MTSSPPDRLCPKCGAYWRCGCVIDEWRQPVDPACRHDWVDAVGVEHDESFPEDSRVKMCRLCGLYMVTTHEDVAG